MNFPDSTRQCRMATPLGEMLLAATDQGLAGAWFVLRQRHLPDSGTWPHALDDPLLKRAAQQLGEYFDARRRAFELPLDLSCGSAFQQAVWRALLAIDWGDTASYRALAESIGRASAVRAVGHAVGRNPLSVIVPCHRVLGSDGRLTGFGGGLDRKTALLALEACQASFDFGGVVPAQTELNGKQRSAEPGAADRESLA